METLRAAGCTIGEYVGDGRGEADGTAPSTAEDYPIDADPVVEHQYAEEDEDDGDDKCEVDGTRPLLILYDCETTGLSIYSEHITDIAAKVVDPPVELGAPTFSSLVRTGRSISAIGN